MIKTSNKILVNLWEMTHTRPYLTSITVMFISAFSIFFSIKSMMPSKAILTRYRFTVLEKKIKLAAKKTPIPKISLTQLPNIENVSNSICDGWGNNILMETKDDKEFCLISFGKDGVKGGSADLHYRFKLGASNVA